MIWVLIKDRVSLKDLRIIGMELLAVSYQNEIDYI